MQPAPEPATPPAPTVETLGGASAATPPDAAAGGSVPGGKDSKASPDRSATAGGPGPDAAPGSTPASEAAAAEPTEPPSPTVAPRPKRQRASAYDFLCVLFNKASLTNDLTEAGDKGWELISIGYMDRDNLLCFQRPKN